MGERVRGEKKRRGRGQKRRVVGGVGGRVDSRMVGRREGRWNTNEGKEVSKADACQLWSTIPWTIRSPDWIPSGFHPVDPGTSDPSPRCRQDASQGKTQLHLTLFIVHHRPTTHTLPWTRLIHVDTPRYLPTRIERPRLRLRSISIYPSPIRVLCRMGLPSILQIE